MVTGVVEQVPRYTISHTDDGTQERLQLTVSLPGLTSAKDFEVRIENDKFILRAEGRYNLTLPLHPPVEETAEVLQFVKRKALLKAELKVLSASDQSASLVSPSSSAASPSFANQKNQADGFRGGHNGNNAPDPDSDDESIPDLLSNDSDSSPDAFPGHANGTTSSASWQSTSTSHAQAHGQPYDQSPESDSDMSDTSPQVRRWSNGTGAMPAAGESAHAAMHGNPLYGVSPASQASHVDAESSSADSADEAEGDSFQHPYNAFQQPQTKQSLETAAAYFKQGFELLYTRDWRRAANLLFEAQLIEATTCSLLPIGMGSLPASLAADVRRNVGAILLEKIEDRMQRNGSGAAKTVKAAWEQAHAVLLLQAIGHPAAAKYGLNNPSEPSTSSRQEQRAPHAGPSCPSASSRSHAGPSRPSASSRPQAVAARSSGRQQPAAAWPSYATSSRAGQDMSGSETSEQEQEEQQHHFFQELHGQRAQATTSASYGPAEQAEAKRQANKEAALTWLDKAKAAAANKDWTAAVQKGQKGLSLDPDADWAKEANSLIQSWQAAQQKETGGSGPADKQSGSGKPHAQAGKGQQQQQSKKQTKKQKRQASQQQQAKQQQQDQAGQQQHQDQPRQQQQQPRQHQEQPSSSKQHDRPTPSDSEKIFGGGPSGSAAHGQYSYTYGPQGQRTESAEPWTNSPSAANFEWLSAVLPLMKLAAGCVGRGCRLLSRRLLRAAVYAAAFVLLCVLMLPQITVGLLYLTGRHDWCYQLAAARKAGKLWAKLVYFLLSPLLALVAVCAVFCLVARGSFAGSAVMTASWVAWPLVKAWSQLKSATSWLHPSKALIHIVLLVARVSTDPSWVKYLSSGLLLWWSLNGGWMAVVTTLLASVVSFIFCVETLGTPVACKLSHVALTNTYITGFFYRAVMMIVIWGCWIFWQVLWRQSLGAGDQSNAQANPQTKPASGAPKPTQGGLPRTGSTDAKTEVRRILSAKTHYAVLEVDHNADEDTVKRAKKMKSLLVHPDKAGNLTGAGDAFGKVINAAEVLCDPSKKRQYDAEQAASAYRPSQPAAPQRRPQEEDDPNVLWQRCSLCEELHRAVRTDMAQQGARWCKECNCYHTVQKGEGWVTRRGFWSFVGGGDYVVYACLWPDGQIYDVTEQSICQGMLDTAVFRQLGPDCHQVWLHFSNPEAANRRQRYQPSNEAAGRKKSKKVPRRRR